MGTRSFDSRNSWIGRRTVEGAQGLERVRSLLETLYARPLRSLAHRLTELHGEPDDLVRDFLDRIVQWNHFFPMWSGSGLRLRHWILQEFLRYLVREEKTGKTPSFQNGGPVAFPKDAAGVDRAYERSCAATFVHLALRRVEARLRKAERPDDARIFTARFLEGRDLEAIAREHGVEASRCDAIIREVGALLRRELRGLLEKDGVPPEAMADEIRTLLRVLSEPDG